MKRLLILNTNFPPNGSIGTQRILRISKYLDKSRWQFFVLTLKEHYFPNHREIAAPVREQMAGMQIYRTGKIDVLAPLVRLKRLLRGTPPVSPGANGAPAAAPRVKEDAPAENPLKKIVKNLVGLLEFPDKDISWLLPAVWRGYRVIRRHKIDVIYSSSPPHSLHLTAAILKMLTGARLVVDFRDPWARSPWHETERAANGFERFKQRCLQAFERWVVKKADRVVFVTEPMCDDFVEYYRDLPREKFQVFYNGFDPENIVEPPSSEAARGDGPLTFMHIGTLYKLRDPTPILHAIHELKRRGVATRENLRFQFIGIITPELGNVPALADDLGISDIVQFVPPVSYRESYQYMLASDVLVLLQPITRLQIPGKFYDYICFEKPIFAVGEQGSAVQKLVENRFGFFVDYQQVNDIAAGFARQMQSPGYDRLQLRENREFFNMAKSIRRFEQILDV